MIKKFGTFAALAMLVFTSSAQATTPLNAPTCALFLSNMNELTTRFLETLNQKLRANNQLKDVVKFNRYLREQIELGNLRVELVEDDSQPPLTIQRSEFINSDGLVTKLKKIAVTTKFGLKMKKVASKGKSSIDSELLENWFEVVADAYPTFEYSTNKKPSAVNLWRRMEQLIKFQKTVEPNVDRGNPKKTTALYVYIYLKSKGAFKDHNIVAKELGLKTTAKYSRDQAFAMIRITPVLSADRLESKLKSQIAKTKKEFEKIFPDQEFDDLALFREKLKRGEYQEVYLELGKRAAFFAFSERTSLAIRKLSKNQYAINIVADVVKQAESRYESLENLIEAHIKALK